MSQRLCGTGYVFKHRVLGALSVAVLVAAALAGPPSSAKQPTALAGEKAMSARGSAVETWESPVSLTPSRVEAWQTQIVADRWGNLTAAWLQFRGPDFTAEGLVVRRKPSGTSQWSAPQIVDPAAWDDLTMAVAMDGSVTVAYDRKAPGGRNAGAPYVSRSRRHGQFSTSTALASGLPGFAPATYLTPNLDLGVAADGRVNVAWHQRIEHADGSSTSRVAWSHLAAGSAVWATPIFISRPKGRADSAKVSTAQDGLTVWLGETVGRFVRAP